MTTFQDPPPQSRRAVRQSERGDAADAAVGPTFVAPQPAPFADQPQRDMWDTTARRVAQLPNSQPRTDAEQPAPGRRAASVTPEPLTYATQQRPQVPTYDGPFRNTPAPADDSLPPTQALPKAEQPTYRVRDYSPEARPAAAAWDAVTNPAPTDLEYHTEARRLTAVPPLPAEPAEPVAPPVAATPPAIAQPQAESVSDEPASEPEPTRESTLSRRELRAMLAAEAANEVAWAQPVEPAAPQADVPTEAVQQPSAQLVEPAPWARAAEPAPLPPTSVLPAVSQPPAPVETASDEPQAWPFSFGDAPTAALPAAPAAEQPSAPQSFVQPERVEQEPAQQPVAQLPVDQSTNDDGARALFGDIMTPISAPLTVTPETPQDAAAPAPVLPPVAPQPLANTGLTSAMSEFDSLAFAREPEGSVEQVAPAQVEPAASSPSSVSTESAWSPPVGHWSTQADLDDETQPFDSTINRRIGSGTTTTNALVLPTPDRDIRGALTGTGEVMLTGSIDLPTTLSSTGANDRVEREGLDMLFDANDHEIVATDSAPVRAIRAVSTHNTGHGVTHTQKPKGTRGLTVLLFVAGGMAVVGLGMLVTVLILNVF